jgi:hypothetical protein
VASSCRLPASDAIWYLLVRISSICVPILAERNNLNFVSSAIAKCNDIDTLDTSERDTNAKESAMPLLPKMYNVTCKTITRDPYTYKATASITVNGVTIEARYGGDEHESKKDVKEGAVLGLKAKARILGWNID